HRCCPRRRDWTASGSSIRFLLTWLAGTSPAVPNPQLVARGLDLDVGLDGHTLAGLHAVDHRPRLGPRDRTHLLDTDDVAGPVLVGFVVRVILLRATDDFSVERVTLLALVLHGHGLVGLVGDDGPDENAFRHLLLLMPQPKRVSARTAAS